MYGNIQEPLSYSQTQLHIVQQERDTIVSKQLHFHVLVIPPPLQQDNTSHISGITCYDVKEQQYRQDFYFVDRFHGSEIHSDRCTATCEAHTNCPDESARLRADNVRNEVVTMRRSQLLKMLSLYTNFLSKLFR
jgi:hypothetical protein